MATMRMPCAGSSSGEPSATLKAFSGGQSSYSLDECNIGDIIVLVIYRTSSSGTPSWNGVAWTSSPDYGGSYLNPTTNVFSLYMKASQKNNTLSISAGAINGGYFIITNQ